MGAFVILYQFTLRSIVLVVSTVGVVQTANSQTADVDNPIEEIQVTATRRAAASGDISVPVDIINSEEIIGGSLLTDALALQPGVFVQQTTPGQGAPIIRGLKGSEVLHLVDGMRLNNAIFRNAPTQYFSLISPGTLARIEVVRGASPSLYGSDAVGGVVQAISRIPSFERAGVRREAFIAFDTADLSRTLRASVDFGNENIAALLSGEYHNSGNRRTGNGPRLGPTGYTSKGARAALALTPSSDRSWLFDIQFATQPMTPRIDELVPGFGQTEPSSDEFSFAPNERLFGHVRHVREDWLWGAAWNFDLGWQRIVDDRVSRGFMSNARRIESNQSDLIGLTISVAGASDAGSWIIGSEIYHDTVESSRVEENIVSGQLATTAARFPNDSSMGQAAIFANVQKDFGFRHSLNGGLRFSTIKTELAQTPSSVAVSTRQNDVSADLGWVMDLREQLQFAANLSYGFRAPNIFDLGTLGERPGNRFNIPNPDLKSERVTQLDAGIRYRSEPLDFDLIVFALHYTDRISSILTASVTADGRDITQSQNIAEADIHGVEFSGKWLLTEVAEANFVLNYLRGEQFEQAGAAVPADRMPPLNGQLKLNYFLSDALSIEPYINFASGQDRLSPRDVRDTRIDPNGTPGWVSVNVQSTWRYSDVLRISLKLENLLDKDYRAHGSGINAVGRNFYLSFHTLW